MTRIRQRDKLVELKSILAELPMTEPWQFAGTAATGVEINAGNWVMLAGHWPAVLPAKLAVLAVNALPDLIALVEAAEDYLAAEDAVSLFPNENEHYYEDVLRLRATASAKSEPLRVLIAKVKGIEW